MQTKFDKILNSLKNFDSGLGDARFSHAALNERAGTLTVTLVSDAAISKDSLNFVASEIAKEFGGKIKVAVESKKAIVDKDIVKSAVAGYIKSNHYSISHAVSESDVNVICAGKKSVYELSVSPDIADYFKRLSIIEKTDEYLSRNYSSDFSGTVKEKIVEQQTPEYKIETLDENAVNKSPVRYLKMRSVEKFLDTESYDTAVYIEDGADVLGTAIFAGEITDIEKRESKKGNEFYFITISDKLSSIRGAFFTQDKQKLKKLEKLAVGSVIIERGENELFNGNVSFTIKGLHLCEFPENYVPEEKPSLKAPAEYTFVRPEPCELVKQGDIFSTYTGPTECLKGKTFVVTDIETTGTNALQDRITEIGAVKIVDGTIIESFETLVNPQIPIPENIVSLTGITDDMVKNSPTIEKVFPDYFKFLGDGIFVAHNAEFDFKFLKYAGKQIGYIMKCEVIDTLKKARETLPMLKNHKLNTVCEHYGIEFLHHRASSDAFATAQAYLEMVKEKNSL